MTFSAPMFVLVPLYSRSAVLVVLSGLGWGQQELIRLVQYGPQGISAFESFED